MKETISTSKRLTLNTPEEKSIRKSWGTWWNYIARKEQSGGVLIICGDWSGYIITHVDIIYAKEAGENYRGTVEFSDGTTMTVWTERVTRKDILRTNRYRKDSYSSLISKLLKSGSDYYKVGSEKQTQPA